MPFKGKIAVAWPWMRVEQSIVAAELPRIEGGLGKGGGRQSWHHDPRRPPVLAFISLNWPRVLDSLSQDAAWSIRRGRSSRSALKGKILKIVAADTPRGRLRDAEGSFP